MLLYIIVIVVGINILPSFLSLIPPIRRMGRSSRLSKIVIIAISGLLSVAIGFSVLTFIGAKISHIFSTLTSSPYPPTAESYTTSLFWSTDEERAVITELWLRRLIPPFFEKACYSKDQEICREADRISNFIGANNWTEYLQGMGVQFCITLLVNTSCTWLFLREKKVDRPDHLYTKT